VKLSETHHPMWFLLVAGAGQVEDLTPTKKN